MRNEHRRIRRLRIAALVLIPWIAGGVVRGESLYPQPAVRTAENAFGLAAGDFNEDGIVDLVAGHRDGQTVAVLIGRGDGTFLPPAYYDPVSDWNPIAVTIGDFNEDGHEDIAYARECDGIGLRLGNGDGTFGPETSHGLVDAANQFIAVGDFDGDGHDDLIATAAWAYSGCGDVEPSVLLGHGDGTFTRFDVSVWGWYLAVGDFNGDGLDDFADLGATVFLSTGHGIFDLHGSSPVIGIPEGIAAGDLNGDTILDLAVMSEGSDLSVLIGNGDGTFQPVQGYTVGPDDPDGNPRAVSIADLDGDGPADVLVGKWWPDPATGDVLWALYGVGGGVLGPPVALDDAHPAAGTIVVEDFDADGVADIGRTSWWTSGVNLLLGLGDRSFSHVDSVALGGEGIRRLATADLDADGRLDLVTGNYDSNDVSVLLGEAAGTFSPEARFCVVDTPGCPGIGPESVEIGELTGDTHLDLLVVHGLSESVIVLEGDGAGGFVLGPQSSTPSPSGPNSAALADFNGDGDLDAAVVGGSNRVSVLLNAGDGSFFTLPFPGPAVGTGPLDVEAGFIDGDGNVDLAVANGSSGDVSILLGVGNGTFAGALTVTLSGEPSAVSLADLDGDSHLDMVAAVDDGTFAPIVQVFTGAGDGTFTLAVDLIIGDWWGSTDVAVADMNGDSHLDVAANHGLYGSVFLGHGDGTFDAARDYTGWGPFLAPGDFNLDSRVDIAGAGGQTVSVLLNQGGPPALVFEADGETLVWPATTGALYYDLYRGTVGSLVDVDDDGLPDGGYGVCMTGLDTDARDTFFVDPDLPSAGAGFYYLMSVIDAGGDNGIGETSAGLPRAPIIPCP